MTKQQTVELLQKQLPGFYSVEQVIEMINGIEEPAAAATTLSEERREVLLYMLRTEMISAVENMSSKDFVDFDSAEMELQYGNQVVLDSIDTWRGNTIVDKIYDSVKEVVEDFPWTDSE